MMFDSDIVKDILRRAVLAAQRPGGFTDEVAYQIEQQVRHDWAGSEPYIAKGADDQRIARNEKIVALWGGGQRDIKILSCRFGLSAKQVRRIIDTGG